MDYVIGYFLIASGCCMLYIVVMCLAGYSTPPIPEELADDDEALTEYIKREHERLKDLWLYRRVDQADEHD